ncbi:MAG: hypothetical protein AAB654_08060 [Acidobacteriota bacterium]
MLANIDAAMSANRLPKTQYRMIASDDRHAPVVQAGDTLIVDTSLKMPEVGCLFVIEYPLYTATGMVIPVPHVQQCRRWLASRDDCYVLGASAPEHRRRSCCDGFYDAAHFARAVLGRVIAIHRN